MRYIREENIAATSFIYAIVMVLLLTFTTGGLLIAKKFHSLKSDLVTLEKELTREQREELEKDVSQQVKRIDSLRHSMGKRLELELSTKVSEVQNMATSMYTTLEGKLSREEIAHTIKEAIRQVRFHEDDGYFFVLSMDGEAILYPPVLEVEGKNFLLDETGTNPDVARNIIQLAKEKKYGFYRYYWVIPGHLEKKLFPKVSYISYFMQLDWIIGTGEYYANLDEIARLTITKDLESSFAVTNDYFFLYEIHNLDGGEDFATMVVNNNRPELVGKKLSDNYADVKGKQFRKEFLKGIRETGEAESIYWYKKPDGSGIGRKMTYFKYYPDWNWVVAQGVYLDGLDSVIVAKKEELQTKVRDDITLLCMIFLVAVVVALIVAYYYAQQLQEIFTSYKRTQQENLASLEGLNKVLEIKSNTDVLTKTYNRGYFNQQFSTEIARSTRYQTPLSLILLDIDRFKLVNDTHGHLTGDMVLQEMAALVQKQIRTNDLFARWGGEEFTVLVPGVEKEDALQLAEKIRTAVAETTFASKLTITCSFGVSSYIPPETGDDLLSRVDKALYEAKENGRNKCVMI